MLKKAVESSQAINGSLARSATLKFRPTSTSLESISDDDEDDDENDGLEESQTDAADDDTLRTKTPSHNVSSSTSKSGQSFPRGRLRQSVRPTKVLTVPPDNCC